MRVEKKAVVESTGKPWVIHALVKNVGQPIGPKTQPEEKLPATIAAWSLNKR